MSLSNVFMIELFRSNNRVVVFFKTEKKYICISQQTRQGPYIYDVHMEGGCQHGVGARELHKITTIQLLEAVVFSSTSSHKPDKF